jgi:hypothetical protein
MRRCTPGCCVGGYERAAVGGAFVCIVGNNGGHGEEDGEQGGGEEGEREGGVDCGGLLDPKTTGTYIPTWDGCTGTTSQSTVGPQHWKLGWSQVSALVVCTEGRLLKFKFRSAADLDWMHEACGEKIVTVLS